MLRFGLESWIWLPGGGGWLGGRQHEELQERTVALGLWQRGQGEVGRSEIHGGEEWAGPGAQPDTGVRSGKKEKHPWHCR